MPTILLLVLSSALIFLMALALATERLREHGLQDRARLHAVEPRRAFDLGGLRIEPIRVTHSVVDGLGYGIETPVGTIVHTGDFKFDPSPVDDERSDYHRLAELGARGVLCLLADSTNVDRPGTTPSELRRALARGEPPEALRALVERIRREPWKVTDEDWAALASYSEDQKFELVLAAVVGAAEERFDAALRALEGA